MYHDDAFQKAYDMLSEQPWQLTSFHSTHLEGTVDAKEDGILFTSIPWTSGWKVTVDGKEAEKVPIGEEGLLGVSVSKGKHTVVMDYHTPGLMPGIVMSAAGVALFCVFEAVRKRKKAGSASSGILKR